MNWEEILKTIIWAGLIAICFLPLIFIDSFYFPFIVPRTILFRAIVEVIFLAFLLLAAIKKEYRPKFNIVTLLACLYIITVSVSSLLSKTFYFSFWSNNERAEGILLLLHLLAFLIVLSGFVRTFKNWLVIFEASFLGGFLVALYSLGQQLGLKGFIGSAGGVRVTATIGNAGYVAGFLIFTILFGLILFFYREKKQLRWYYAAGIALQSVIVFKTLTRGGMIALVFSAVGFLGYLVFVHFKKSSLTRNSGIAALAIIVLMTGFLFASRDADWVRGNPVLQRITTISIGATTAQNRLMTWESAYKGFKEKPLLGYGYENFYQVFDKYFNAKIYRKAGSVVWFDRGHNIIADRVITGGLIGLLLYLSMLFVPLIWLWKHFGKREEKNKYLIPVIFSLIVGAYFIQNFFIFEAIVTYVPLFVVLAFMSQYCPNFADSFFQSSKPYIVGATLGVIMFSPVMLSVNVKWAATNTDFIKAFSGLRTEDYQEAYKDMVEILDRGTPGNQEYRQHLAESIVDGINAPGVDQSWLAQATVKVEEEMDKLIEEKPLNARNYMMTIRYLNKTHTLSIARLSKALDLCARVAELSPTRPQVYYETAYSQIYLAQHYESGGRTAEAEELMGKAVANMQKAIDLQPLVLESYINMVMVLFVTGKSDQVQGYLDEMDELGVDYRDEDTLFRMANSSIHVQDYEWTAKLYEGIVEVSPDRSENWINLALAYAFLGRNEEAIRVAEHVAQFSEEGMEQAKLFIENVKSGFYLK